jgi:hypothetical protein
MNKDENQEQEEDQVMDSSSVLEYLDINSFMSREDEDKIQRT